MKKNFFLLLLALMAVGNASAKLNGNGYYRIWNSAVEVNKKERAFCCVTYNSYQVSTAAGTQQDLDAIPLYPGDYAQHSDPAAVIYVQMSPFDLSAQGTSVSNILSGAKITLTGDDDGKYVLTGKVKGMDSPVYSTSSKKLTDGVGHYILTSSNTNAQYKYWSAAAVDSESDEWYFGVKPTLVANGKYYAPYCVSFPFEPKSEGMKVYYVSAFNDCGYTLEEIKGIVPADTPVLIECSSADPSKNRLTLHEPGTRGTRVRENKLTGNYFYNPDLGLTLYPNSVREFNAATMRVWNVENGELVLSTAKDNLKHAQVGKNVFLDCLTANSSYLVVPATAATTLHEGGVQITFDCDGGSSVAPIYGKAGEKITLPATPVKAGYTFAGWSGLGETFPSESVTVKALWTPNNYTITFDCDGGVDIAPLKFAYGSAVTAPAAPVKAGYTFAGWVPELPATMPIDGITVKAQWTPNNYTITFDCDGGSEVAAVTQAYGSTVTAPAAPVKAGYTFAGWDPALPETMPIDGITVKAQWTPNNYTITFDCDGGSEVAAVTQAYGSTVTKPAEPTKAGYTFVGWDPALPETMPIDGLIVKAQWTPNQYTITFNTAGGTEIAPITQDFGSAVTAPANPTKDGYVFLGWIPAIPETMPIDGVTVEAQWRSLDTYSIIFDTKGGSAIVPITGYPGAAVTAPANPTKVGYTFAGWVPEIPEVIPEADCILEAQWTPNNYTITFDCDGGSEVTALTQAYGSTVTAPAAPVKAGYTFAGWDPALPETMPIDGLIVKAQWTINNYTIKFDCDGGSEVAAVTQAYGSAVTKPAEPTKVGYTFAGWDPELPATMPIDGLIVKAQWTPNKYTITFNTAGGTEIAPITQDFGSAIVVPDVPVKFGYTFNGWSEELPATMPAENKTLTATWIVACHDCAMTLSAGWNWIAFPMCWEEMGDVSTMLAGGNWTAGDEIKTHTHVAAYTKQYDKWIGSLTRKERLEHTAMYKLRSNNSQTSMVKESARVLIPSEVEITVNHGWNYIAFLPAEDMTLSEALSNYVPSDGDIIKSQDASSVYSDVEGWVGELKTLCKGQGYMLWREATQHVSFRYPDMAQTKVESVVSKQRQYRFADNMTVVANIEDIATEAGDSIVAMVDGDVRGAAAVATDGKLILTVEGDKAATVSLALVRDGVVYAMAKTSVCYESDAVVGSLANPTAISFVEDDTDRSSVFEGNVIAIYTIDGMRLNTLNPSALSAGTYIVYAEADGKTNVTKITKK